MSKRYVLGRAFVDNRSIMLGSIGVDKEVDDPRAFWTNSPYFREHVVVVFDRIEMKYQAWLVSKSDHTRRSNPEMLSEATHSEDVEAFARAYVQMAGCHEAR